jgi:predicted N-acyltransferase
VFDHSWADAYARAGGRYYPKLQIAVPFTPVPGPRLLVRPGPDATQREALLAAAATTVVERNQLSGLHITFLSEGEWSRLGEPRHLKVAMISRFLAI